MNENMSEKEQAIWVFQETARQIVDLFKKIVNLIDRILRYVYVLAERIDRNVWENAKIEYKLENLTDYTLIDRMTK